MITPAKSSIKSWQLRGRVPATVLLIIIVWIYGGLILFHLSQNRPYRLNDIFFYTLIIASPMVLVLLLLLRFITGERFNDLNLKPARWWLDVLGGIGLPVLTLGTAFFLGPMFEQILPGAPHEGLDRSSFAGLAGDPMRLALFLGPGMMLGVAGFEELLRVLLLSRWWKIASGITWHWLGILVAALLTGLAHLYQGPGGVMTTAFIGVIWCIAYLRFGRVWPLIISHYIHDALQIVLFVFLIQSG